MHTTEECIAENTITSASEGVKPFPKSTDIVARSSFNPLRPSKHEPGSVGKLSANAIHFDI